MHFCRLFLLLDSVLLNKSPIRLPILQMFLQSASYATGNQAGYLRLEFKVDPLQIEVHNSKETGSQEPGGSNRQQPKRPGSKDQPHRTVSKIRDKL